MEGRGETFLPACWEFITFNLLFVLLAFIILNFGFRLLFNYKISKFLRAFSSFVFLAPMLLEGNLQYFFFLLFSQISLGFSLNPRDKMMTALNYIIYFFIIWLSVVSCFLAYYLNKKLAKYILDNWKSRVHGLLVFSLVNAVRMLVFGAVHSLLRCNHLQLPLLLTLEITYVFLILFSMRKWQLHRVTYKIWFSIIFSVFRICLQIMLIIQDNLGVAGSGTSVDNML
jgi:hypothetical protein